MSMDSEKTHESFEDIVNTVNVEDSAQEVVQANARQTAERRLVRKLDCRLLPVVVVIYFMNFIDRAAVTSARLKGLQTDLGLSDVQYDTVVAVLFASYGPAQIPSNIVLNYISRPTFYIGTCAILWGLTSAVTGVTHNFAGIVACRVFIGLPEASFYPGAIYLLSRWYTRKELALRTVIMVAGLLVASAFGSFWAAGIFASTDGVMGIAAWRWLFFIEGAVTIFIGFIVMWILPDYPHNTRWLTSAERRLAQVRIAEDAGEADMDSRRASILDGLKMALKDLRVLLFMLMGCCFSIGVSFISFLPTLAATFGYSTTVTLLLIAPPWVCTAVIAIVNARHADMTGERFFHVNIWIWITMCGYIISISTMNTGARYFSIFLLTSSICGISLVLVWVANVVHRPPAKRSAAIGLVNGFASVGAICGSYIWKAKWGPTYHLSMIIAICALAFASFLSFVIRQLLVRENKRMQRAEMDLTDGPERERIEEAAKLEGITFEKAVRRRTGFRYLY